MTFGVWVNHLLQRHFPDESHAFTVIRYGDYLEITGACPWCPCWEEHFHRVGSEPFSVDRTIIPVAP